MTDEASIGRAFDLGVVRATAVAVRQHDRALHLEANTFEHRHKLLDASKNVRGHGAAALALKFS